jgi:uncharacterized protein YneF (UPF0154 family)
MLMFLFIIVLLAVEPLGYIADRIIRSELADTTEIDHAKIRTWLRNKDSKASEYAIVESWLSVGDSAHAVQVLDSIPIRQKLSAHDSLLHGYYKDWVELRLSFANQEKDLSDLDSTDMELVEDIAEADSVGLAAAQTRGLLNAYYYYDYRLHPKTPSTGGLGIMAPPSNGSIATSHSFENAQITAFPNPAKEIVKFKYKLNDDISESTLTVHDMAGRLAASILLQGTNGTVEWKTDGLSAGVYYYKATSMGGTPQKLVLIK